MLLPALLGFLQSALVNLALFFVGKILTNPEQLRKFLGLAHADVPKDQYFRVSIWVATIGRILQAIAIISILSSLITTFVIFSRM